MKHVNNFLRLSKQVHHLPSFWYRIWYQLILLVLFEVAGISSLAAQSQLMQPVEVFSVQNTTLAEAIRQLSVKTNLNFTYDASDPAMEATVDCEMRNKTPLGILDELLRNTKRTYKQIGNQIVIYHDSDPEPAIVSPLPIQDQPEREVNPVLQVDVSEIPLIDSILLSKTDTLYIKDTLVLTDTIVRTDTLRLVDTVYIAAKNNPGKNKPITPLPVNHFAENPLRTPGWAVDFSIMPLVSNFSTVFKEKEWSLRSYSFDAQLVRHQKRWSFLLGLQFSQFAQKFNHNYVVSTGGYYQIDTLDVYYSVVGTDTTLIAVTDSTYLPLESEAFNYDKVNRVGYLGITAAAEYLIIHRPVFSLSAKAGIVVNSLVYRKGLLLENTGDSSGIDFADMTFASPVFGLMVGVAGGFRLNDDFQLRLDAGYRFYTTDVFSYPDFNSQLSAVGVSVGIRYYLK